MTTTVSPIAISAIRVNVPDNCLHLFASTFSATIHIIRTDGLNFTPRHFSSFRAVNQFQKKEVKMKKNRLAGIGRIELPNARFKVWRLTAWLYPHAFSSPLYYITKSIICQEPSADLPIQTKDSHLPLAYMLCTSSRRGGQTISANLLGNTPRPRIPPSLNAEKPRSPCKALNTL